MFVKINRMAPPPEIAKPKPLIGILLSIGVFIFHVALGFALYRGRVISKWTISESDFVVFILPILMAMAGYGYALHLSTCIKRRPIFRIIIVLATTFISLWTCMYLNLNTYGS